MSLRVDLGESCSILSVCNSGCASCPPAAPAQRAREKAGQRLTEVVADGSGIRQRLGLAVYLMALSAVSCVMQKVISVSIASLGKNGENLSPCISCFKVEQCFWRGALGDIGPKVKGTRDAPKPWALFHLHPAIKRKISKVQAGSICRLKREGISSISLQITPCVRDDTLHEVSMNRTSRSPHNCYGMVSHG